MKFRPVFLEPDRALNGRASQTLLRHYSRCPRSGYLYQQHGGGAPSREMQRGKALHLIHERAVRLMLENGEVTIPPELVKTLADEVLAEVAVPFEEHDYVREMAFRLGEEIAVDPERVVAVETLFALDVPLPDGEVFTVRCRIDFAEVLESGGAVHVEDFKSSRAAVSQEDLGRKRPDGSLAASSFQLVLYALSLAYGVPVREEMCGRCDGSGWLCAATDGPHDPLHGTCCKPWEGENEFGFAVGEGCPSADGCPDCFTKGRVETREPFPVASRAATFDLEFVYPGIEGADGKMLRRKASLTRAELEAYRASLAGLVGRLVEAERSGDWPAVVSDQACSECPASSLCPIPAELRDHRGTVNTVAEAAEAFEVRARVTAEQRAIQKELRGFVEHNGPVRFGNGMVAELSYSESESVTDKEGLFGAVEMAVRYGEPFERWRYVRTKGSTRLVERKLTEEELLAETEGSDE